ncbi:head protein [Siminovitchia terrae]|uniref:YjcQ family protein n=1 Tax=Siminovitchia terrae TaxID=1914933 RepID=UPI001B2A442C|nr:YjcQ family protein [Siminovitchia terrae]GIN89864.1 head protein [Siminovitchia terrae]
MAKETKDVIIAILQYLNESLDEERIDFSKVNNESLGISYPRYCRILSMMMNEGYIEGLSRITIADYAFDQYKAVHPCITLKGIDYLEQNKPSSKAYAILKEIRDWIPGY